MTSTTTPRSVPAPPFPRANDAPPRRAGRAAGVDVDVDVLVVGAGFSGLAIGQALRAAGIHSFRILEKATDVGGTWRENHYPGAACDVPSHLYSFSFDPDPGWTRAYSPQPEILAYLRRIARRHDLLAHIQFGAHVEDARFDDEDGVWTVTTRDGGATRARALVLGNGALHLPSIPAYPGASSFSGPQFHSAKWDHDVSLRGRRVAVVGTGASAIQFVPAIQPDVAHLTLFQRTAPWVVPKRDFEIPSTMRDALRAAPLLQRAYRAMLYAASEVQAYGFVYDPRVLELLSKLAIKHLEREVRDPVLREKLRPTFTMGCKRILLSNDYYRALTEPNVTVDTSPIERIEPTGLRTRDGALHEADVLLYGTGFSVAEYLSSMRIHGSLGRELNATWSATPEAYLGIAVHGFPNLYLMMGPSTGLGHNSMVFMIETQARFATACIERILDDGLRSLDVTAEAQADFQRMIDARMPRTVWATGCASWYQAGESGKIATLWPGSTLEYWVRTRRPRRDAFDARR